MVVVVLVGGSVDEVEVVVLLLDAKLPAVLDVVIEVDCCPAMVVGGGVGGDIAAVVGAKVVNATVEEFDLMVVTELVLAG